MSKYILDCIGNTPLVELPPSFFPSNSSIYVKLEQFNLGGSIKSRAAYQMILDAESNEIININKPKDNTIVEGTGGNTGIGIAQVCALKGYKCVLVVPDNYSKRRIEVLKNLGAKVILSDSTTGNDSHIIKAKHILSENPSYIYLNQFSNESNPKAHLLNTGPEIISEIKNKIDFFVAGVGTGGTISGVGKAIKNVYPNCKIVAVQPKGCDVLKGKAVPHIIQGIAIGQVPKVLDRSIIDYVVDVEESEVMRVHGWLAKQLGLYVGLSAAANVCASILIASTQERPSTIVTIAPDGGLNYDF